MLRGINVIKKTTAPRYTLWDGTSFSTEKEAFDELHKQLLTKFLVESKILKDYGTTRDIATVLVKHWSIIRTLMNKRFKIKELEE